MLASRFHGRRLAALVALAGAAALGACGSSHFTSAGSGGTGGGAAGTGGGAAGTAGSSGTGGSVTDSGVDGPCTDADGDNVTTCQGDCDDNDKNTYPGAPEICGDGRNNGCTNGPADAACGGKGTFVSTKAGSSSGTGTMTDPVDTIAHGLQNAQAILQNNPSWNSISVYVAEGNYPEKVILVEGISLLGGFSCTPTSCTWKRDPKTTDSTILDTDEQGVVASHSITRKTYLDGFHIQGKSLASTTAKPGAAAITITGGSPVISGNTIEGPVITNGGNSVGVAIGGIGNTALQAPGPLVLDNTIHGGQAPSGASTGIVLGPPFNYSGSNPPPTTVAEIRSNTIYGGNAKSSYGITASTSADGTLVGSNVIGGGTGSSESWGIGFGSTLTIDANRINADATQVPSCPGATGWCGGITSWSGEGVIVNNIVFGAAGNHSAAVHLTQSEKQVQEIALSSNYLVGAPPALANQVPAETAVIVLQNGYCSSCGTATVGRIRNNFLMPGRATQRYGILEVPSTQDIHPDVVENNDFWFLPYAKASDVLYEAKSGVNTQDVTDLSLLPNLGFAAGNFSADCYDTTFHLSAKISPNKCIDKGVSADAPDHDFEGDKRPQGGGYDVGPDEAP